MTVDGKEHFLCGKTEQLRGAFQCDACWLSFMSQSMCKGQRGQICSIACCHSPHLVQGRMAACGAELQCCLVSAY